MRSASIERSSAKCEAHAQYSQAAGRRSESGAVALLTDEGRAPALLNGGLDAYAPFMLLFLGAASYLEINTVDDVYQTYLYKQEKEYVPGNLEFDPLGLSDKLGRTAAAEAEIYNGRLAMLAITGFAMQEALWGQPVVDQWSIFFKPAF